MAEDEIYLKKATLVLYFGFVMIQILKYLPRMIRGWYWIRMLCCFSPDTAGIFVVILSNWSSVLFMSWFFFHISFFISYSFVNFHFCLRLFYIIRLCFFRFNFNFYFFRDFDLCFFSNNCGFIRFIIILIVVI